MRGEGELHVRVRLARLGIEMLGGARMEIARLFDHGVAKKGSQGHDRLAIGADHGVVLDPQLAGRVQL